MPLPDQIRAYALFCLFQQKPLQTHAVFGKPLHEFPTVWILMRRRVTRRLIPSQAVDSVTMPREFLIEPICSKRHDEEIVIP